jgi:site-specific recombinase XerD
MAFAEKRDGKLTGWWCVDAKVKKQRFRGRWDTKAKADGAEAYFKATGLEPPNPDAPAPIGRTFREAAEACKVAGGPKGKWLRERDHSAIQRVDWVIDRLGHIELTQVTQELIQAKVVQTLSKLPGRSKGDMLSGATINRYLAACAAVLTYAAKPERQWITIRPTIPWQEDSEDQIRWYSLEGEKAICAWLIAQGYSIIELCVRVLVLTGMRAGELLSLEVGQLDIGAAEAWIRLWKNKTDHPRSVPIDLKVAAELRAVVVAKALPDDNLLWSCVKRATIAVGQDPKLTVHSLRHTTATRLLRKTGNLKLVKTLLGHASLNTTLKYAHIHDEELLEAADFLTQQRGQTAKTAEIVAPAFGNNSIKSIASS